jgi:hypothetical protein
MNKKILLISILAVFVLLAVSFSTIVSSKPEEQRESPLYGIRTRRAITEKITNIMENIRPKFLRERMFFITVKDLRYKRYDCSMESVDIPTCPGNPCTFECTQKMTSCPGKFCGNQAFHYEQGTNFLLISAGKICNSWCHTFCETTRCPPCI